MAKKEVAEAALEEAQATEEPRVEEPKTDESVAKISKLEKELEEARAEAKSHQKFGEKTRAELEKQRGLEDKVDRLENRLTVVTEMLAETLDKGDSGDFEDKPAKRRSDAYLERLNTTESQKEKERTAGEQAEYIKKANALWERAKVVFANDDDNLERVEDALTLGKVERAEARVAKAEASKEKPVESEEERIERRAEEKARQKLEESGVLETDTGLPGKSGGKVWSRVEIDALMANPREFGKQFPGGVPEILELVKQGKIQ